MSPFTHVPLKRITIIDGARLTTIAHPTTGERITHGLGAAGDPLRPYLDHRHEGYLLVIPTGPDTPIVRRVETSAAPLASGHYPTTAVPWASLGADDVDPFAFEGGEVIQ